MDYVEHCQPEAQAFVAAARAVTGADPAPAVPSCPGWTVTDLVLHLGYVHRFIGHIISGRLTTAPQAGDLAWLALPAEHAGWMRERATQHAGRDAAGTPPDRRPLPAALVDWCNDGAAALEAQFRATVPGEPVWTWAASDQTAGFWQRMQAIEAAVHRWDAQNATGSPS